MSSEQRERERHATASANTAKHKTGYNRMWEADHTWVFYIDGEGMYCKLCQKFATKNHQNQAKVWNMEPCTTLRKDVLARHEVSAMYKKAVELAFKHGIILLLFSLGEGRGRGMLPDPHNIRIYL